MNDWQSPCGNARILCGDAKTQLAELEDGSVQCCVTSPPYWGLRNYGHADQLGQEKTPEEYIERLRQVFAEVRRVLRDDGTLWLNLGDSYARQAGDDATRGRANTGQQRNRPPPGYKPKDLIGIPWMVAFALRADGWYLRQKIPWVKRNSMPESVTDRPASACETIFLLSKSEKYYYDHESVKLPASMAFQNDSRWQTGSNDRNEKKGYADAGAQYPKSLHRIFKNGHGSTLTGGLWGRHNLGDAIPEKERRTDKQRGHSRKHAGFNERWDAMKKAEQCSGWRTTRNSDWFFEGLLNNEQGDPLAFVVSPAICKEEHFATFPPTLIKPMILAGCPADGVVLDPFLGSGTTSAVSAALGRRSVGVELNPAYCAMARERIERELAQTLLAFDSPQPQK